jgi:hypothetical protein
MPSYAIGLDLGQVRDYSALVLTERVQVFDHDAPDRYCPDDVEDREVVDEYHVRHIRRWSLGTDYTTVVDDVAALMADDALAYALLAIDRTGVGGGVVDLFRQYYRDGRMGEIPPRALTLTAGVHARVASEGSAWTSAHKGDLIGRLLTLAQRRRIKVAPDLPGADALTKELRAFELKQNARTGNVRFEAKRESDHDDLVIALALSVWFRNTQEEPRFIAPDGTVQEKPWCIARCAQV